VKIPGMEGSKEDDSVIVTVKFISVTSISIEDTVKSLFLFQWPPLLSRRRRQWRARRWRTSLGGRLYHCNSQIYFNGLHFQIGYGIEPGDGG
jgi:hypothetical protein